MQGVFVHLKCFTPMFSSAVWTNVHRVFFWFDEFSVLDRCSDIFFLVWCILLWCSHWYFGWMCLGVLLTWRILHHHLSQHLRDITALQTYINTYTVFSFLGVFYILSASCGQMYMFLFRFFVCWSFADLLIYPSVQVSIWEQMYTGCFFIGTVCYLCGVHALGWPDVFNLVCVVYVGVVILWKHIWWPCAKFIQTWWYVCVKM